MAYTPVTFVYGEVLTAAKMNMLAANDASFHDGSGLPEISVLEKAYPVGSIFMSATLSTATAVAEALGGGTWVAWGTGRVPVGIDSTQTEFDTAEETGGTKTNTIANGNLPSATIAIPHISGMEPQYYGSGIITTARGTGTKREGSSAALSGTVYSHTYSFGKATPDSLPNLQPYITCYMWKRTA